MSTKIWKVCLLNSLDLLVHATHSFYDSKGFLVFMDGENEVIRYNSTQITCVRPMKTGTSEDSGVRWMTERNGQVYFWDTKGSGFNGSLNDCLIRNRFYDAMLEGGFRLVNVVSAEVSGEVSGRDKSGPGEISSASAAAAQPQGEHTGEEPLPPLAGMGKTPQ